MVLFEMISKYFALYNGPWAINVLIIRFDLLLLSLHQADEAYFTGSCEICNYMAGFYQQKYFTAMH